MLPDFNANTLLLLLPYLLVLGTAMVGWNVAWTLVLGILSCGIIGLCTGGLGVFAWVGSMGEGITGMGDLIIVTLLAAGMLELIRAGGGLDFILRILQSRVRGKRGAELCIAAMVSIANVCTANNTIAIITTGSIAKDISTKYGIDARRSASLLDTFSCSIQGLLPYGAQILIAASLTGLSPLSLMPFLFYPYLMGIMAVLAILLRFPRQYARSMPL
jgi:Na+/H+ antiporter NhaC